MLGQAWPVCHFAEMSMTIEAARRSADWALARIWATRVRRLISPLIRSVPLLVRSRIL